MEGSFPDKSFQRAPRERDAPFGAEMRAAVHTLGERNPVVMDVTTLAPGSTAKLSSISHVAWDDRSDVLRRIVEPHLNLCIWRRKADPFVVSALGAILRAKTPLRLDLRAPARERIEQEIRDVFPALAAMRGCAHLVDDAHLLASLFAELAGTQHPRVRLERVEDDGCVVSFGHVEDANALYLCGTGNAVA